MLFVFLALALYLVGIGVIRAALFYVHHRWDVFEDDIWFTMLAICWPATAIPVAAYIWSFIKFADHIDP